MIQLRGHHIFCLLGYRGKGYSEEYVENMTAIHQKIRINRETLIEIINGPDVLCAKYPANETYHCQDEDIYVRDEEVLAKLGLQVGQIYSWREIESQLMKAVKPKDLTLICESCSWRAYGYCEEGLQRIQQGKDLKEIE